MKGPLLVTAGVVVAMAVYIMQLGPATVVFRDMGMLERVSRVVGCRLGGQGCLTPELFSAIRDKHVPQVEDLLVSGVVDINAELQVSERVGLKCAGPRCWDV